ncbi:MAG: DUF177 domain-containing protein [Pseudomonadota bacterium]
MKGWAMKGWAKNGWAKNSAGSAMPRPTAPGHLPRNAPFAFAETATEGERSAIAAHLAVRDVGRLRIAGHLHPVGTRDWRLSARLTGTIVQSCVVTLDDVATRLDLAVTRHYAADLVEETGDLDLDGDPVAGEEVPERLPQSIDLGAIAVEEAGLALDPYPRRKGAVFTPVLAPNPDPAEAARQDRPFADLAAFAARLDGKG